jgi:hypothetical protein
MVGGLRSCSRTRHRQVATKAKISGPVGEPNTSTLPDRAALIQNAFFRAILPGFEEARAKAGRSRARRGPELVRLRGAGRPRSPRDGDEQRAV